MGGLEGGTFTFREYQGWEQIRRRSFAALHTRAWRAAQLNGEGSEETS